MIHAIVEQLKIVGVLAGISMLISALLDAFFGISFLHDLFLHSKAFIILFTAGLWLVAIFITRVSHPKE